MSGSDWRNTHHEKIKMIGSAKRKRRVKNKMYEEKIFVGVFENLMSVFRKMCLVYLE